MGARLLRELRIGLYILACDFLRPINYGLDSKLTPGLSLNSVSVDRGREDAI